MIRRALCLALLFAAPAFAQAGFDPFHEARIDNRIGSRVPLDAIFRDERGQAVSLRTIGAGKPIVLVPVLHDCPNICGVTLAGLGDAVAGQSLRPGRDFAVIAFGIDPKETSADARGDLDRMHARRSGQALDGAHALVGTSAPVRAVTDALGYRYAWDPRIGQYAHAAAVAVLTPEGRLSSWLYGLSPQPHALEQAVRAASQGAAPPIGEALLLLCYHYDPVSGTYTPAIEKLLRIAAALTVGGLGFLLFRLRRSPA